MSTARKGTEKVRNDQAIVVPPPNPDLAHRDEAGQVATPSVLTLDAMTLLSPGEVAKILKCTVQTLANKRSQNKLHPKPGRRVLPHLKNDGSILYRLSDLQTYIDSCRVTTGGHN